MSEINITAFVAAHGDTMTVFANSIAESGLQDIGAVTWRNALAAVADESDWLTTDVDALRDYFREFGAWDRAELTAMSGQELNALLVQFIAGDYQRYTADNFDAENEGGALYQSGDEWFFYVGH